MTHFSLFTMVVTYLTLASTTFAISKPVACPSPDSLRSATWMLTKDEDHPNQYTANAVGNFGTANEWMAGINCITATNEQEARQTITDSILANISPTSDIQDASISGNDSGTWACTYKTTYQFPSNCSNSLYTLTPVPQG